MPAAASPAPLKIFSFSQCVEGSAVHQSGRNTSTVRSGNSYRTLVRMASKVDSSICMTSAVTAETSYLVWSVLAISVAASPDGSRELTTMTKGFPAARSSRMTRSSASAYSSRGISVMDPSVVTMTPIVAWSAMTFCVPISAASVIGISWSNHGVLTMRGSSSSN